MKIALATAAALPELDEDGPALLAALAARGCTAEPAIWTDPSVDWARFDRVIVRSTWDYAPQRDAFLAWAERVDAVSTLLNPPAVLRWNTDKRYLSAFEAAVPTTFVAPGETFEAPETPFVIKPSVSAGSVDTMRFVGGDAAAADLVSAIHQSGRTVMVQPYQADVDQAGETALLFFRGTFSHAIRKGPMLRLDDELEEGLYREERITARIPSDAERALADTILATMPFDATRLPYARIDLIPSADGPRLLELELAEPSVFLGYADGATDRFAAAICEL
jgi:glutathione synthase/RimK-type ligase-like ATP-grasp enzyme